VPVTADAEVRYYEGRAMASSIALSIVGALESTGELAWAAVTDEFAVGDRAMSRFRDDSEITALNRAAVAGRPMPLGRRLRIAVTAADRAWRVTGGRFDPRVVDRLDRLGYRGADVGAAAVPDRLGAAERPVPFADATSIRLGSPIDLGGIGKGLALRWARDRVSATAVSGFLLDAGGDIVAAGPAPDGGPWRIGIEDPAGGDAPRAVLAIRDGAVATSSIRRLTWVVNGRSVHHLIDPATGDPAARGLAAVTVAAVDPAWAEVWSKALFVAGRPAIAALARSRGLAAWWIGEDGDLEMTAAARIRTTWVAGES
jgi:thiamine biosynthesis lipoprotein